MIVRDAGRIDFPEDVPFLMDPGIFTPGNIKIASADIWRGLTACAKAEPKREDLPGPRLMRQVIARYRPGKEEDLTSIDYLIGFEGSMVVCEAIRITLDRVGYENLTSAAVLESMKTIKDFDTGGLGGLISFADYSGDRCGAETFRMWAWDTKAENIEILTDWFKGITPLYLGYLE